MDRRAPQALLRAGSSRGAATAIAIFVSLVLGAAVPVRAAIETPPADPQAPIHIRAAEGQTWTQGAYEVWRLKGTCRIAQGGTVAHADEMLLWIERHPAPSSEPDKVIAYLEGNVDIDWSRSGDPHAATGKAAHSLRGKSWLGRFHSFAAIRVDANCPPDAAAAAKPAIFHRAMLAHAEQAQPAEVRPAQFTSPEPIAGGLPTAGGAATPGLRQIIARPRSQGVRVQARTFPSPDGREQVVVVDSGVNIVITGLDTLGTVDISTDRLVMWTAAIDQLDLSGQGGQRQETPLEIYLEGNIVFRQGDRVIYAQSMYYNVNQERGTVLNAEMLTPVPSYRGLLRLKADVLTQVNRQQFSANGAAVTTSRLGVPRYWFQSETVTLEDKQRPLINPFNGQPEIDPATGDVAIDHELLATSSNNFVYLGGVPVFYWPTIATDLTQPGIYLERIRLKNDNIFGTQVLTDWDMYQLLGLRERIQGTTWDLSLDYLSERGFGVGTTFDYDRQDAFGLPSPVRGFVDAWGLHDSGLDTLGRDRIDIEIPQEFRGRVLAQHWQDFGNGLRLGAEVGYVSDKNFLEQYFESEWDQRKDEITGLELRQQWDNKSWSLAGDVRINNFFAQTNWWPRLDGFVLGQPLGPFVWHSHSHVGYGKVETAVPSPFADDPSTPLAWETDSGGVPYDSREGIRAGTRQELDLPLDAGPARIVPYLLGDVTYWGEDRDGNDLLRGYAQVGVRGTLPLWRVDPAVQSELWNLNGLAHKVTVEGDFYWSDASQDLDELPLYDPVDDDAQEAFRRRFFIPGGNFFGATPAQFAPYDERFYALRTGMQGAVVAPSLEIADDLMAARLGVRQRWQTKRGLPGRERIIDWITLDIEGTLFPKPGRDNFGQELGQFNYDFRWHIGDRLTILSDGYADFFGQGLRTVAVGGILSRPEQGDVYLAFRSIEGPVSSNVVTAAFHYRLSEKWIGTVGASVDLSSTGNIGQRLAITRIGESFLATLGFNVDSGRDNVGVIFTLEPRFLTSSKYGQLGGIAIPPAGARGLE